jgi:hypothetical protein
MHSEGVWEDKTTVLTLFKWLGRQSGLRMYGSSRPMLTTIEIHFRKNHLCENLSFVIFVTQNIEIW